MAAELMDQIESTEGVAVAQPRVSGRVELEGPDGDPVEGVGPTVAANLTDRAMFVNGRAPAGSTEFAVDASTARSASLVIGRTYQIRFAQHSMRMVLVGMFELDAGRSDAPLVAFDDETALRLLNDGVGYDEVAITVAVGEDRDEVAIRLIEALPDTMEVLPGDGAQPAAVPSTAPPAAPSTARSGSVPSSDAVAPSQRAPRGPDATTGTSLD